MTLRTRLAGLGANVLLALMSLGASLLLAELAISGLGLFERERAAATEASAREAEDPPAGKRGKPLLGKLIHPYTGWMMRPGKAHAAFEERWSKVFPEKKVTPWFSANRDSNLFGFRSGIPDYRQLPESDFVIGIFGGSVAAQLALLAGDALVEEVARREPALAGRIRIANCAAGGFKQPQQLFVLSQMLLLGVPFDAVVNVDGLNEVRSGAADASRGHHPLLPSRPHWLKGLALATGAISREELELTAEVLRAQRLAGGLRSALASRPWLRRSALVQSFAGLFVARWDRRAVELEARLQELPGAAGELVASLDDPCLGQPEGCWDLIADLWERSSTAMAALAVLQGAVYVHVLQPSQYVEGSKELTPEELQDAFKERSHTLRSVRAGYPRLLERAPRLRGSGVSFHDLTMIFTNREETIYSDECCHYNWLGNQLVAREIGRLVAEALDAEALDAVGGEPEDSRARP